MKAKSKATPKQKSKPQATSSEIDSYLEGLPDDQRAALQKLRETIRAAVPRAEECISYKLPAFQLDGKVLVLFGAATRHCTFTPAAARPWQRTKTNSRATGRAKERSSFCPPPHCQLVWSARS